MPAGPVTAKVRYINTEWRDRADAPRIGSRETRRANTSFHDVEVQDVRAEMTRGEIGLDDAGFTVTTHESGVREFTDREVVTREYYPEMTDLACRVTGAARAFVFNHQIRTEHPPSFNEGYARFVHCDHHLTHSEKIARETLERAGVEPEPHWSYACYNTWQPFDHPVEKNPLAYIDARSLPDEDVIDYYYAFGGGENLVAAPVYNPAHRFCYLPDMQTTEILLLKQLDGRPGRAVCCPHTSFDDPRSTDDSLPRRSIETRLVCVFEHG